jgi:hypothetical protein
LNFLIRFDVEGQHSCVRPAMDVGLRARFNGELKGPFYSEYDYAEVYVLLLYWKDDHDDSLKVEADALDDLFGTHFNYPRDYVE